MKYEKKCKVIRLSSNGQVTKTGYNLNRIGSNKLYYCEKGVIGKEAFHIYILAPENEEIKIDDIVLYQDIFVKIESITESAVWVKRLDNNDPFFRKHDTWKLNSKKIIASTDSSLNLPKPSNEFLKKYCEDGGIDEVMVEYEDYCANKVCPFDFSTEACEKCPNRAIKIKTAPDNTITIRKVKDTWTRKEVEILIHKAICFARNKQLECGELSVFEYDDWLKENL